MDEITKGIIIAVIEGVTEFLPVSSTGHMILAGDLINFTGEKEKTFSIAIQLGAILSVVFILWPKILVCIPIGDNWKARLSNAIKVLVASLPALMLGAAFHKVIKEYLFSSASVVAALFVGALVMIAVDNNKRKHTTVSFEEISYFQAFMIGLCQCFALWPGFSRSGATIIGGLLVGLTRKVAAEFSFIVAIPVMFAAVGYELLKSGGSLGVEDIKLFLVGSVVAFVTAGASVVFLLKVISSWSLKPFAVYRILLASTIVLVSLFL